MGDGQTGRLHRRLIDGPPTDCSGILFVAPALGRAAADRGPFDCSRGPLYLTPQPPPLKWEGGRMGRSILRPYVIFDPVSLRSGSEKVQIELREALANGVTLPIIQLDYCPLPH